MLHVAPTAAYLRLVQITSLKQRDFFLPQCGITPYNPINCWLLAKGKNLQELPTHSDLIHFQPLVTVQTNWTNQHPPEEKEAGAVIGETSDGIFSLVFTTSCPSFQPFWLK